MTRAMKISLTIAVLILVFAAVLGWSDNIRLAAAAEEHRSLTAEAMVLELSIDEFSGLKGEVLVIKRMRVDKGAEAKLVAKDFIAFAAEINALQESGEGTSEAIEDRMTEYMDRMYSLDAGQLKVVIAEFRASTEINEEARTWMHDLAIMTLADHHPENALAILVESPDLLKEKHSISSSLEAWAARDPHGALEWFRKNAVTHPDLIDDDVKAGLVEGAATNDVALGFDLLKELEIKDPGDALQELAQTVNTAGQGSQFLGLLREYSKTTPGFTDDAMVLSTLASGIAKEGFDVGSKWITDNSLSPKETDNLARSISNSAKSVEKGKGIEWMGKNISSDNRDKTISSTMRNWTQTDYRAAGKWLATAPERATKYTAVKSYAETVARYDPATATQWALTLPAGEQQQSTLQDIHSNMPKGTPQEKAAREAFKAQHGIE